MYACAYPVTAVQCEEDPFEVANDETGQYDWDLRNKSFTHEVVYSCPIAGKKNKLA